jgi:hypothetical protein
MGDKVSWCEAIQIKKVLENRFSLPLRCPCANVFCLRHICKALLTIWPVSEDCRTVRLVNLAVTMLFSAQAQLGPAGDRSWFLHIVDWQIQATHNVMDLHGLEIHTMRSRCLDEARETT